MWVLTVNAYLFSTEWGSKLLAWVFHLTAKTGAVVSNATFDSWQSNRMIVDASDWVSHLPGGETAKVYYGLAIACLIVRLFRRLPGWLSLIVALPAAVYGVLGSVSGVPFLLTYWPLTVVMLVMALVVVGKTVRRY